MCASWGELQRGCCWPREARTRTSGSGLYCLKIRHQRMQQHLLQLTQTSLRCPVSLHGVSLLCSTPANAIINDMINGILGINSMHSESESCLYLLLIHDTTLTPDASAPASITQSVDGLAVSRRVSNNRVATPLSLHIRSGTLVYCQRSTTL